MQSIAALYHAIPDLNDCFRRSHVQSQKIAHSTLHTIPKPSSIKSSCITRGYLIPRYLNHRHIRAHCPLRRQRTTLRHRFPVMNSSNKFGIPIVTDEGPALFRILKWIVDRLSISPLDEGLRVFKVPIDGLNCCVNTVLLYSY